MDSDGATSQAIVKRNVLGYKLAQGVDQVTYNLNLNPATGVDFGRNRGFLVGPQVPLYGSGAMLLYAVIEPIRRRIGKKWYGIALSALVAMIAADALDTPHRFTVSDGTDSYTLTVSALGYCKTAIERGGEAMANLGKALYLYNRAAEKYFGA